MIVELTGVLLVGLALVAGAALLMPRVQPVRVRSRPTRERQRQPR